MASNWTPGLRNQVLLDSIVLPVLPGSTFSMPRNLDVPQVFSGNNIFQFVYVEGLQYPVVDLQLLVHKSWWNWTRLNAWFTRTDDDVASAGTLQWWNGATGFSVSGCKVNVLSIGASIGQYVRCRVALVGTGTFKTLTSRPDTSTTITDPGARFQHVTLGGGLSPHQNEAHSAVSFDLTLSNNLDVCPELDSEFFQNGVLNKMPDQNSGQLTASMRLVMQAKATRPADGTDCTFAITAPGATVPVTFTVKNPVCLDPREMTIQFPRQLKEYNYVCLGDTPDTVPVTIS